MADFQALRENRNLEMNKLPVIFAPLIKKDGGIWPADVLATLASRVLLPSPQAPGPGKDEIADFLNPYHLTDPS